jgi:hypothetical protein
LLLAAVAEHCCWTLINNFLSILHWMDKRFNFMVHFAIVLSAELQSNISTDDGGG